MKLLHEHFNGGYNFGDRVFLNLESTTFEGGFNFCLYYGNLLTRSVFYEQFLVIGKIVHKHVVS